VVTQIPIDVLTESGIVILPEYVFVCHAPPHIQSFVSLGVLDRVHLLVRAESVNDGGHIRILLGAENAAPNALIRSIREVNSLR
jgi:hypothetical protein